MQESADKHSWVPRDSRESRAFAEHCTATHNDCHSSTHCGRSTQHLI